jgi:hypothetical protein
MGQDWSEIWLQRFSGTVTIWPKTILSDFWNILSDPSPQRLDRMLIVGQRSCWPKIRFISNRMKVERLILEGVQKGGPVDDRTRVPNPAEEREAAEALLRARRRPGSDEAGASSDDNHLKTPRTPVRRQSSILEELTRQASVLWNDEATEGDEDPVTTDEGEADADDYVVASPTETY